MIFVKLIQTETGRYSIAQHNNEPLTTIASFLTDDVGQRVQNWKNWINNPQHDDTSSNISYLEKEGDNIVVGYLFAPDDDPYKYSVTLSKQNLLETLEQWEQLCKEKPQEIWIFEENGRVWLEGKN